MNLTTLQYLQVRHWVLPVDLELRDLYYLCVLLVLELFSLLLVSKLSKQKRAHLRRTFSSLCQRE